MNGKIAFYNRWFLLKAIKKANTTDKAIYQNEYILFFASSIAPTICIISNPPK
jgi:hypothetical protein